MEGYRISVIVDVSAVGEENDDKIYPEDEYDDREVRGLIHVVHVSRLQLTGSVSRMTAMMTLNRTLNPMRWASPLLLRTYINPRRAL